MTTRLISSSSDTERCVEVRRTDRGDHPVDGDDLRVQHRRLERGDADAVVEQLRVRRLGRDLHEALVGVRARATGPRTSTPRSAAAQSRSVRSSSGTKYAVVMRSRCGRELQERPEQERDVALTRVPPRSARTARRRVPGCACSGNRSTPSSKRSRSVSAQSARKAARSPSTAGPSMRKCVSRHSCSSRASPFHSSAIPTPPVNATASSMTTHLAVGAVVQLSRLEAGDGTEPPDHDAGVAPSSSIERPVHRMRAPPVEEHPDPHAVGGPGRERLGEPRADLAVPVDERQEVDRVASLRDRVEHGREDPITVDAASRCGCPRSPRRRSRLRGCAAAGPRVRAVARSSGRAAGPAHDRCDHEPTAPRVELDRGPRRCLGLGLGDLDLVLRVAAARRARLRAGRRRPRRRGSRSPRAAPRSRGRPCRPTVRRSRRTTSSSVKNAARPTVTVVHSTTETTEPKASHDAAGWWRRGHQRKSIVTAAAVSSQTERPTGRVPRRSTTASSVHRVAERAAERECRERTGDRASRH